MPWYKTAYPCKKLHTMAQNFIPGHKTSYRGTKLHTQAQNFTPGYVSEKQTPGFDPEEFRLYGLI
jgi:hypothetical protein